MLINLSTIKIYYFCSKQIFIYFLSDSKQAEFLLLGMKQLFQKQNSEQLLLQIEVSQLKDKNISLAETNASLAESNVSLAEKNVDLLSENESIKKELRLGCICF